MRIASSLGAVALALLAACGGPAPGHVPVAALDAPETCDLGTSIVLDAGRSSDADGDIVLYRFTVADGSPSAELTMPRLDHVCRTAGLIEAAVAVVDREGNVGWAASVISVRRP
jgi:hypothetical protein